MITCLRSSCGIPSIVFCVDSFVSCSRCIVLWFPWCFFTCVIKLWCAVSVLSMKCFWLSMSIKQYHEV